jgi:chemotaxis protein MotA
MVVIFGAIIVFASIIVGYLGSSHWEADLWKLWAPYEYLVICGGAFGGMVIMAPWNVLMRLFKGAFATLKGTPYTRQSYDELFQAMYELFMLARKNGMIALEEHVNDPESSAILSKYPNFLANKEGISFLCEGLRPVIDGKVKGEQLHSLLEVQLDTMKREGQQPIDVINKTGDALPGFGIVAAVLGIVLTMGIIDQKITLIGKAVGHALVGTFTGILVAYGFVNPLGNNMALMQSASLDYLRCMAAAMVSFTTGSAPALAMEISRRRVAEAFRCSADEMEELLKAARPR